MGNVTGRRVRSGEVLGYGYDALNRLTLEDLPNPIVQQPDTSYDYDLLGWLVAASGNQRSSGATATTRYGGS